MEKSQHPSRRQLLQWGAAVPLALGLAACSGPPSNTLKVSYQQWGSGKVMHNFLTEIAQQFAQKYPGYTVELVPLVAAEDNFFTKNELMMSSERTTPDLAFEDTFILKSDVAAGYLRPLTEYVENWPTWNQFYKPPREAVTGSDGKVYAVPVGTDTRALWYNRSLFAKAGLPEEWKPRTWPELLETLRTLKAKLPGVVPFNIFAGKAQGEKASMQGFEMLIYGTKSTLYNYESQKWVAGSKGFTDSLEFIRTVFAENLTVTREQMLNPNFSENVYANMLPEETLAINLDGSWINNNWREGSNRPWEQWPQKMALAPMPTQNGQDPGFTTLAGGWCWAIPAKAPKPDKSWQLLQLIMEKENLERFNIADGGVTVRDDIASSAAYQKSALTTPFFTELVKSATYRPALAVYPQVSSLIQMATEKVMLGQSTAKDAAKEYDAALKDVVGAENVEVTQS